MENSKPTKIGLSLSGGGYRATAFHLGTMKQLHEMGILEMVDIISTISGGSITGACYCTKEKDFDGFYKDLYEGLQRQSVVKRILLRGLGLRFLIFLMLLGGCFYFLWTAHAWIFPIAVVVLIFILLKFQFYFFPVSKYIERAYDHFFYKHKMLEDLPEKPKLIIGSTNIQTARPFMFTKHRMQDSTYQFMDVPVKFKSAKFPVARAVMASSCVPFAFTPETIHRKYFENPADADKVHPILVDGGVYDNQGIHKVMQQGEDACGYVITSDAGCGSQGEMKFKNTISLLMETVNIFMSRIKKEQMVRNVYDNAATANKQVAYFSLGWDIENCIPGFIKNLAKSQIPASVVNAHQLEDDWIEDPYKHSWEITEHLKDRTGYGSLDVPEDTELHIARTVGTNLTALRKAQVDALIKQARALTALQVKLYCPNI